MINSNYKEREIRSMMDLSNISLAKGEYTFLHPKKK